MEEVEQDIINNSVEVNIKKRLTVASLSLMQNPAMKLAPNKTNALQDTQSANLKIRSKTSR